MCRVEVLLLLCSIALTKCIALNIDVPVRQIIDDGENNNCGLVLTDRYSYLLPTYDNLDDETSQLLENDLQQPIPSDEQIKQWSSPKRSKDDPKRNQLKKNSRDILRGIAVKRGHDLLRGIAVKRGHDLLRGIAVKRNRDLLRGIALKRSNDLLRNVAA